MIIKVEQGLGNTASESHHARPVLPDAEASWSLGQKALSV